MSAPRTRAGAVRLPRRFGLRTLLALVTALCLYLGSYLALVQPREVEGRGTADPDGALGFPTPSYGFEESSHDDAVFRCVKRFYAPLHWLDRRLRPEVWAVHARW